MLWALVTMLLIGALAAALTLLAALMLGSAWKVRVATVDARRRLRRDLAALTSDQLRTRLLADEYFAADLRRVPAIAEFLSRVQAGEETTLARHYSRRRLYRLLTGAERAANRSDRPEAVDAIDEIYEGLQELARRGLP